VFFTWGSFNALETILTFYFQKAQGLSAIRTSLYFLPAPVSGTLSNVIMGLVVHRVKANYLVLGGCLLSVVAPLVLVGAGVDSDYWKTGESCSNSASHETLLMTPQASWEHIQPDRRRLSFHHRQPPHHVRLSR